MSTLNCLLDFGCYCTFARCGETCVVLSLRIVRVAQYTSNWRTGLASSYTLYFHLGRFGSTLCWDMWSGTCVKVVNYLTVECVRCIETKP